MNSVPLAYSPVLVSKMHWRVRQWHTIDSELEVGPHSLTIHKRKLIRQQQRLHVGEPAGGGRLGAEVLARMVVPVSSSRWLADTLQVLHTIVD